MPNNGSAKDITDAVVTATCCVKIMRSFDGLLATLRHLEDLRTVITESNPMELDIESLKAVEISLIDSLPAMLAFMDPVDEQMGGAAAEHVARIRSEIEEQLEKKKWEILNS